MTQPPAIPVPPAPQSELAVLVYRHLVAHDAPETIAEALRAKGVTDADMSEAFTAAHTQLLNIRGIPADIEFARALAAYDLLVARSIHVNDYKTAKSAIDSKVKLLQYLEANA